MREMLKSALRVFLEYSSAHFAFSNSEETFGSRARRERTDQSGTHSREGGEQ